MLEQEEANESVNDIFQDSRHEVRKYLKKKNYLRRFAIQMSFPSRYQNIDICKREFITALNSVVGSLCYDTHRFLRKQANTVMFFLDDKKQGILLHLCQLRRRGKNIHHFLLSSHSKYLRPQTTINFSINSSESRTAICAALPIRVLAFDPKAWWTSNRTKRQDSFFITGSNKFVTISRYAEPALKRKKSR